MVKLLLLFLGFVLSHGRVKSLFDCADVVVQFLTIVDNKLPWLLLSIGLHLHFDQVKKWMWLPVPRKLDILVLEQLLTHNVTESVVFVLNHESGQIGNLTALGVSDLLLRVLNVVLAIIKLLVD